MGLSRPRIQTERRRISPNQAHQRREETKVPRKVVLLSQKTSPTSRTAKVRLDGRCRSRNVHGSVSRAAGLRVSAAGLAQQEKSRIQARRRTNDIASCRASQALQDARFTSHFRVSCTENEDKTFSWTARRPGDRPVSREGLHRQKGKEDVGIRARNVAHELQREKLRKRPFPEVKRRLYSPQTR